MVDEESGHRPVWGLRTDASPVSVKLVKGSGKAPNAPVAVRACVHSVNSVVGTDDSPARLLELELKLPHEAFNRRIGVFAGRAFGPDGETLASTDLSPWLPSKAAIAN